MWKREIRDAVTSLEDKYDIELVSIEHHTKAVDEIERLREALGIAERALDDFSERAAEIRDMIKQQ